jgi:hypothetical protein
MNRIKLRFPWEVPKLDTEEELRDFWDTHEHTDEFTSYLVNSEQFFVSSEQSKILFIIENIPAIKEWESDGTLISSSYESHIEESLLDLKKRLSEFVTNHSVAVGQDKIIYVDFVSRKSRPSH